MYRATGGPVPLTAAGSNRCVTSTDPAPCSSARSKVASRRSSTAGRMDVGVRSSTRSSSLGTTHSSPSTFRPRQLRGSSMDRWRSGVAPTRPIRADPRASTRPGRSVPTWSVCIPGPRERHLALACWLPGQRTTPCVAGCPGNVAARVPREHRGTLAPSVHRARRHDPLDALASDPGDAIEVRVVVQDRQGVRLRRGGDQQIGHLPAPLMLRREEPLHLTRTTNVVGRGFDQLEGAKRINRLVPLLRTSRR